MGKKSKIAPAQKPPSENQIGYSIKFDLIDWIDVDNQIFIQFGPIPKWIGWPYPFVSVSKLLGTVLLWF